MFEKFVRKDIQPQKGSYDALIAMLVHFSAIPLFVVGPMIFFFITSPKRQYVRHHIRQAFALQMATLCILILITIGYAVMMNDAGLIINCPYLVDDPIAQSIKAVSRAIAGGSAGLAFASRAFVYPYLDKLFLFGPYKDSTK